MKKGLDVKKLDRDELVRRRIWEMLQRIGFDNTDENRKEIWRATYGVQFIMQCAIVETLEDAAKEFEKRAETAEGETRVILASVFAELARRAAEEMPEEV